MICKSLLCILYKTENRWMQVWGRPMSNRDRFSAERIIIKYFIYIHMYQSVISVKKDPHLACTIAIKLNKAFLRRRGQWKLRGRYKSVKIEKELHFVCDYRSKREKCEHTVSISLSLIGISVLYISEERSFTSIV